ncbi:MAG: hypothetical protein ACI9P7_000103 [Candidatus Azotimanducaceae bacterium]|jgi:hypothetical protein
MTGFPRFLVTALQQMEIDSPAGWRRFFRLLDGVKLLIYVDKDISLLEFKQTGLTIGDVNDAFQVELRTTKQCFVDIVEGSTEFLHAVKHDLLFIRCNTEDLVRFHEAMVVFLVCATKSREIQSTFDDYSNS